MKNEITYLNDEESEALYARISKRQDERKAQILAVAKTAEGVIADNGEYRSVIDGED